MPVWGVWCNGAIYLGTDRSSRKARNLAANPAVAVHAEAGEDAVILEGTARETAIGADCDAVDRAYEAKYQMKLTGAPGDLVVFVLHPDVVRRGANAISTSAQRGGDSRKATERLMTASVLDPQEASTLVQYYADHN